jgi:deferrochelatase/peroxidase EfeB
MFDGRFGLAASRPAALIDLPDLPGDYLDPAFTGGDLAIQACADDPQVAFHALRNLARLGRGTAVMRWSELGFGRTSSTSSSQVTPRNLMGFKDGTNNVLGDDLAAMSQFVWVGDETDQAWMKNGSYMVARRVRMLIEAWDRDYLADQQNVFGRFKDTGAPLTGTNERDTANLTAMTAAGQPVIPMDAHIRLASPASNGGYRILRRGYSFTDGIDPLTGELDAGLFFIAFQKDPRLQFVPLQRQLGSHDALNEYIKHTGSGIFACPPGVATGGWWGQSLFG